MATPLISIRDLKVHFKRRRQLVQAVDGVSLDIQPGETVGLVGESGCGKTTLGRAILRLSEITNGSVFYRDQDLAHLSHSEMQKQRRHLQMIFQDPYASLDPRMTVAQILSEPLDTFS
jgi:ABC-type glutathione transport system ATPase component